MVQYSCLGNPVDRGALWATVHRVAKSQTRLSTHTYVLEKGPVEMSSKPGATPRRYVILQIPFNFSGPQSFICKMEPALCSISAKGKYNYLSAC